MNEEFGAGWSAAGDLSFLDGSASLGFGGRVVVQPENGAIPAGWIGFKPDEPEHGANCA